LETQKIKPSARPDNKPLPTDGSEISVRLATESDSLAWDTYLSESEFSTIAHRWGWSKVLASSFGVKPFYIITEQNGVIVGILPTALMKSILFGKFLISLPWLDYGGPIANDHGIVRRLVDSAIMTANENDCSFLEMRAVRHRLSDLTEKANKVEFRLDLRCGEESLWKSFDSNVRNQVRKAEKNGLSVKFGAKELLDSFYAVFSLNMRDLGTPVWPKKLFAEIFRNFPNETEIAIVSHQNKCIAAALLLHYRNYSIVPSASADRRFLKFCPNNILYWEIIKHCLSRGSIVFDFGRSSEGAGTYHFKKQWVKNPQGQIWQYKLLKRNSLPELNPSNPKYKLAINIWRKLPLPLANFLGPKIVTKLP